MAAYQNFQAQGWTAMAQKGQWARKDSFCIQNLYGIYTESIRKISAVAGRPTPFAMPPGTNQ
jgi:hypothetical protein